MHFSDIFIKIDEKQIDCYQRVWQIGMNVHSDKGFDYVKK
jgi:hypothetical protein